MASSAPQTELSPLARPVNSLHGVGPERAAQLARLEIHTVEDLLLHRPKRYEDRRQFRAITQLRLDEAALCRGKIVAMGVKWFQQRRKSIFEIIVDDGTARLHCRWWNLPFMEKYFAVGEEVVVFGRLLSLKPRAVDHPETEVVDGSEENSIHLNRITPIYPLTEGLPQRWLRALIWRTLAWAEPHVRDSWPEVAGRGSGWPSRAQALHWLHFPTDEPQIEQARERLALDEFIEFQLRIQVRRRNFESKAQPRACLGDNHLMRPFLDRLDFDLTPAQTQVLRELRRDMSGSFPMRRLLQGDVGSGKTVVAAACALMAIESGYNVMLMAPTEILAEQHFATFKNWFEPLGLPVDLQTGSHKTAEPNCSDSDRGEPEIPASGKQPSLQRGLQDGPQRGGPLTPALSPPAATTRQRGESDGARVDRAYGGGPLTPALSPPAATTRQRGESDGAWVEHPGVAGAGHAADSSISLESRDGPEHKTSGPLADCVPSNCPGPRHGLIIGTHALLTEGFNCPDLGLVVIDEQHKFGVAQREQLVRKGVYPHLLVMTATPIPRTLGLTLYGELDVSVLDGSPPGRGRIRTFVRSADKLPKVWAFIREKLAEGRQAYVVYPRVEETDAIGVKAVTRELDQVRQALAPFRVDLIHGRLKPREKEDVMTEFRAGQIKVLLATSLVEVGLDVPNASILLVENAEQFGLAQLHQLRGRVGRGSLDSYCILVAAAKSPEARQRLQVLAETTDGFRIAEADLELRGPGELLGQQQSGAPRFRFGDLTRDWALIQRAREVAAQLVQ